MEFLHDSIDDLGNTDFAHRMWEEHQMGHVLDEIIGHQYARTLVITTGNSSVPYQTIRVLGKITGRAIGARTRLSASDEPWVREADQGYLEDRACAVKAGATVKHWNRSNSGVAIFQWSTEIGWAFTQTPEVADRISIHFGQGTRCEEAYPVLAEAESTLLSHLKNLDLSEMIARIY